MKTISNEQKANEYLYNEVSGYINLTSKNKRDIINAFIKGAEWKDKQYDEEKRDLLELINMIKIDEQNQTIIEDLKAILQ